MATTVTEIAPDVFRISTLNPDYGIQFNQFLVRDREPFLMHTGFRRMFPATLEGVASVLESGARYDAAIAFYKARGSRVDAFREIVVVRVQRAQPIDSPAYDLGLTEDEVRGRWERYFQALRAGKTDSPADE